MISAIQKHINFDAIYKSASVGYHRGVAWLKSNYNYAYAQLPTVQVVKVRAFNLLNTGKSFAWQHKKLIVGGSVAAVVFSILYNKWKNRPQYPDVKMATTLGTAVLDITHPKGEFIPPRVTLTFCVDMSNSMNKEGRGDAVKRALNTVLRNAQGVVDRVSGAKISLVITGFTNISKVITSLTQLTSTGESSENTTVKAVKGQIDALEFSGSTQIFEGIQGAIEELLKAAKANKESTHTLILLTDGEGTLSDLQLSAVHKRLAQVRAQLFVIGIGKEHKKETLQMIAQGKEFTGTYIDTTQGEHTIETAISTIYQQVIASFRELELTTIHVDPNAWSVQGAPGAVDRGQRRVNLGALEEGKTLRRVIQIHGEQLRASLDLASVSFTLTFTDPRGRTGTVPLPWEPSTTIDPEILAVSRTRDQP